MAKRKPKYRMRRDSDGALHRVVVFDGVEGFEVRFTDECSGCSQHSEGYRMADPTGCHECGYTGKRRRREWVPFEFSDVIRREERANAA